MQLLTPNPWPDYELIDCGNFEKLERFGSYILARPEPQAIWDRSLPDAEWQRQAHARFRRDRGQPERGVWEFFKPMNDPWYVQFQQAGLNMTLKLSLTSFKHVGLFPEQATNWTYIADKTDELLRSGITRPRVLNLFAYTGAASVAARQAGADVTHVEAVRQMVSWSRENMEQSRVDNIRWVVDDAVKFCKREERRGNTYHGLILDPPAYGRGPDGEKWVLEEDLNALLRTCAALLDPERYFFIINLYSLGFSALLADNLIRQHFGRGEEPNNAEWGELYLPDQFGKRLPLGVFSRFSRTFV